MTNATENASSRVAIIRIPRPIAALLIVIAATTLPSFSQSNPDLQTFRDRN
jgi:hypothetical protein